MPALSLTQKKDSLLGIIIVHNQKKNHKKTPMKSLLTLVIFALSINIYGQDSVKNNHISDIATIIKVTYNPTNYYRKTPKPAFFIDSIFVNSSTISAFDPDVIEKMIVIKEKIEIYGKEYFGQIYITTKDSYTPKLISLYDLQLKHTNIKNGSTVFFIDDNIVKEDVSKCKIDENYVLEIIVNNIITQQENTKLSIIRIITKTEENIIKSKKILIR